MARNEQKNAKRETIETAVREGVTPELLAAFIASARQSAGLRTTDESTAFYAAVALEWLVDKLTEVQDADEVNRLKAKLGL